MQSAATATTVASGAALQLQNDITVGNEALTISVTGLAASPAGVLRNLSGANMYGGPVTMAAASRNSHTVMKMIRCIVFAGSLYLVDGVVKVCRK